MTDSDQSEKVNTSTVDESQLSLVERRALAAEKVEKAKQERMRSEFVRRSAQGGNTDIKPTNSDNVRDPGAGRSTIAERFENAKVIQQKIEEERLARVKVDGESRPLPQSRRSSLQNVWADALHESKNTEQNRVQLTRKNTVQQIRWLDGSGIVKAKIGEWEELFMQIAATMDQLEDTLIAAHSRYLAYEASRASLSSAQILEEQRRFRESANTPERFILGETQIFNSRLLENQVHTYLKHSLSDSRTRHIALSCGIYGEQSQKPQIDLFAAAIKTDDNSLYIAITIKPSANCEDEKLCYGVYKVAVFSKDVGQRLLERIVNVTPANAWDESKSMDLEYSYSLNASSFSTMDVSDISSSASDEGEGTWKYLATPPKTRSDSPSNMYPAGPGDEAKTLM